MRDKVSMMFECKNKATVRKVWHLRNMFAVQRMHRTTNWVIKE